jgi:hypothetical protein
MPLEKIVYTFFLKKLTINIDQGTSLWFAKPEGPTCKIIKNRKQITVSLGKLGRWRLEEATRERIKRRANGGGNTTNSFALD